MAFSTTLADYIANACDMPSLFIGKYGDLEINYIWSITKADAWGRPLYSTIVIRSNKWIRGFNHTSSLIENSQFVELSELEDNVAKLCRQYTVFPHARNVLDGYMLKGGFFEKGSYIPLHILNPRFSHAPESVQLDSAFEETHKIINEKLDKNIHKKSEQNIDTFLKSLQPRKYQVSLIQFLISICIFDLSGIFEETNAPDDLEYILEVTYGSEKYIFAKTRRWFRCVKLYNNLPKKLILELTPPTINWYEILTQLQGTTAPDFRTRLCLYQKAGVTEMVVQDFSKSDEQAPHWNVLRRLIEILNQES